ncbi:putative Z3947 protein [Xenorhabdus bovienii str. oregonense]|uniref:Putative Z3947 protein n=1 Tax=Xenorhabdus bovienii str. oregonense TaxID=1398202 RepID=A0A077P874_XENBV|nr:DUF6387 family protein [Xenorhabdus bovienii]CDH07330.1 putative Z3947 protein [Xenorhabdus bovienii str. oregonense]
MKNKPDYCPEWFDLDNYDICHKFNRIAWWNAIMQRKAMIANDLKKSLSSGMSRDYAISMLKFYSNEASTIIYNNSKKGLDQLRDDSISEIGLFEYIDIHSTLRKNHTEIMNSIDKMFKVIDGYQEKEGVPVDSMGYEYAWHDYDMDEFFPSDLNITGSFYEQDINSPPYIHVDLYKNDDLIINDFTEWLKKKRKQENIGTKTEKISDNDLSKLAENKVLPYIDLYLWKIISGQKITQYQMANLLFPNEYEVNITDRLRLVTKPKAMALLESKIDLIM